MTDDQHFADWASTTAESLRNEHHEHPTVLYQTSLMSALLAGVYDGDATVADLLKHGDFGLGTFNHLDGEMVILDGAVFHLHADGTATAAEATDRTPFAAVLPFTANITFPISGPCTRAELTTEIENRLPSPNLLYGVRIDGLFRSVSSRTVRAQHEPYPLFTEVAAAETTHTAAPTIGTVVGFRMPDFEQGVSVAGYHLHYLSNDRSSGGHILDFVAAEGHVSICVVENLHLQLPDTAPFRIANLAPDDAAQQIHATEGN